MQKYYDMIREQVRKKDLIPKLICIFLALILWAYISKTQNGDIKFKVPLTVKGLNKNYAVSRMSDRSLTVRFRGTSEELKNTSLKNLKLYVDLAKPDVGKYRSYKVQYLRNQIPEDVDIYVSSDDVKVLVEKRVSKKVRVVPVLDGNTAGNHITGKVRVSPEYIFVSGAESYIDTVEEVRTEEILLRNSSKTITDTVSIDKSFKYGDSLDFSSSSVTIVVPIVPQADVKEIESGVNTLNADSKYVYELLDEKIKIKFLSGGKDSSGDADYRAFVDLSQKVDMGKSGDNISAMRVKIASDSDPSLKKILYVDPEFVRVKIKVRE